VLAVVVIVVLAGCGSLGGSSGIRSGGFVTAERVDEAPANVTIVDADAIDPVRNGLYALLSAAATEGYAETSHRTPAELQEIERQLSAAPEYENSRYLRYEGEVVRVSIWTLN
jgi:uncharacterized lipoprotein